MGEIEVQMFHGLAIVAAGERGPAPPAATRQHHGEPRVARAGPQSGLAQPRMSHDRDTLRVDILISLEIIHGPAQAPSPGRDRAPLVPSRFRLPWLKEQRPNAIRHAAGKVRFDVAVIDRAETVAPR